MAIPRFRLKCVDGEVVLVIVLAIAAVATMIFLAINDTSEEDCLASGGLWLPGHAFISGGMLIQSYECYKVKNDPCKAK